MAQPDANRRFPDRGITEGSRLELSDVVAQCERQRARAERQRNSAVSMRKEAHDMRDRVRLDWLRAP